MPKIIVKFKEMLREEYTLEAATTTIGRAPTNGICIDNLAVSRTHAQIVRVGDSYILEDLHSNNGTYVNGERITRHTLVNKDTILVCKHTLLFIDDTPKEGVKPALQDATKPMATATMGSDHSGLAATYTNLTPLVPPATAPPAAKAETPAAPASASPDMDMDFSKTYMFSRPTAHPAPAPTPTAKPASPSHQVVESRPLPSAQRLSATQKTTVITTATLTLEEGELEQKQITLTQPALSFGKSSEADIHLSGFFTPAMVATIHHKLDGYFLVSLSGCHRTKLNGEKIEGQHKLTSGDQIEICGNRFRFTITVTD